MRVLTQRQQRPVHKHMQQRAVVIGHGVVSGAVTRRLLSWRRWRIYEVPHWDQAIEYLTRHQPTLVILFGCDRSVSHLTQCVAQIRNQEETDPVPILITSAVDLSEMVLSMQKERARVHWLPLMSDPVHLNRTVMRIARS